MKDKKHLTPEGLNLINNIKEGMNKLRKKLTNILIFIYT